MKYLYVTHDAIKEIATTHQFQSPDFDEAKELTEAILGNVDALNFGNLQFSKNEVGGHFYTLKPNTKQGIIFTLETFKAFEKFKSDTVITIFQKVLKFALRYFEKLPPTICEKHIPGTNICIVFPFPFIATKESYRVLIDKNLENRRLERRDIQFLIVYTSGLSDEVSTATIDFQAVNKYIEEAPSYCIVPTTPNQISNTTGIKSFNLTELNENLELSITEAIGLDNWHYYLTNTQKEFITKSVSGPERLEGAAGTGKTLSMILRSIYLLSEHEKRGEECHLIFITHSISTKKQISEIFKSNFENSDKYLDRSHSIVSINITTLQEWCIEFLGNSLGTTEYLDKDAQDSKILQKLYLEDALEKAMTSEFPSFRHFCSPEFIKYIEASQREDIIEMLQHEVSVTIKGRANENIERYKSLPRLKYSIPCKSEGDLNFLFLIFRKYQESLQKVNQFDSDDIILTALGQLDTPIWRRRRQKDGYNVVFVDETHLFNLNEMSIIHNLAKEEFKNNIIFTLDKSQAVGDRGLVDEALYEALQLNESDKDLKKLDTIFRSSPEIINVAFNILSSGATLFTSFENPLNKISFGFIEKDGKRSLTPKYISLENEERLISESLVQAEKLKRDLNTTNSRILIVATSEMLFTKIEKLVTTHHKPVEFLKSRGDLEIVNQATRNNRFILAGIDYVGGLEFDGVIICGTDKGRVPPTHSDSITEATHFTSYAWHNRMYVAVTRAKYAIVFMGEKSRGISPLLESSIQNGSIQLEE